MQGRSTEERIAERLAGQDGEAEPATDGVGG
jgi:hypothetical protein